MFMFLLHMCTCNRIYNFTTILGIYECRLTLVFYPLQVQNYFLEVKDCKIFFTFRAQFKGRYIISLKV